MWVNTWIAALAVMAWIVGGLVATGAHGAWWISGGAVMIAIMLPPITYRYATAAVVRLISTFELREAATAPDDGPGVRH